MSSLNGPTPTGDNYIQVLTLHAAAGRGDELRRGVAAVLAPTWAEPGCILYYLHEDFADPQTLLIYEIWRDEEALETHTESEHVRAISRELPGLLAEPMTAVRLRYVPASG